MTNDEKDLVDLLSIVIDLQWLLLPKATSWANVIYNHLLNTQYPLTIELNRGLNCKIKRETKDM